MEAIDFKPQCLEDILKENENFRYEELETDLLNDVGLLFLDTNEELNKSSLENLLLNISDLTKYYVTKYSSNKELIQCGRASYRSIADLFLIAKFYRPETTIKETYYSVYNIIFNNPHRCWLCNDAQKMMYFTSSVVFKTPIINSVYGEDEFGFKFGTNHINTDIYIGNILNKIKDYGN